MYRILIVDDEKTERECIRFLIEEAGIPLEIMDACDGSDALHILKDWQIDILFTDVQMPLMDGLALIRHAQKIHPDLKIIIFSGYADFEYARTAITLGVENYILKPVVPQELEKNLIHLIQELDEEQDSRRQLDKQLSVLLQYSLQLSISGGFDPKKADAYVLEQLPTFQNMVLLLFNDTFLENNYFTFNEDLQHSLQLDMEFLNLSPGQALLMLRTRIESPLSWGRMLLSYIEEKFNTSCYLSISQPLGCYPSLKDAFAAVEGQIEQRFWEPEERIFISEQTGCDDTSLDALDDNLQMTRIRQALNSKDILSLQANLDLLFQKYSRPSSQSQIYVKFIFSNLLTTLYPHLPSPADERPLDVLVAELYLKPDISEIIRIVQGLADNIIAGFTNSQGSIRREITQVTEYISKNYGSDLSVEMLASIVFLTPDYLSRLFKKTTGKSLSQYIRQYRMDKARELLIRTNKKIIDIGIQVGYPNYSYFCQSFREYFGTSPEKYRQEKTL